MNGKNKGSLFERDISKKLSLWLTCGKSNAVFWRSHNSGGRYTIIKKNKNISTSGQSGDICHTDPSVKYFTDNIYLELKNYKDINLWGIITSNGVLNKFWDETKKRADEEEKFPVLIVKENNKPILWICNEELSEKILIFFDFKPDVKFLDTSLQEVSIFTFERITMLPPNVFESMLLDNILD